MRRYSRISWILLIVTIIILIVFSCSKGSDQSSSSSGSTSGTTTTSVHYRGVIAGSTGYLDIHLQGSAIGGANKSYIIGTYIDSLKTPVTVIKDSLTTSSLTNWQPGTAITNAVFSGSTGMGVTLVSVDADGSNAVTKMQMPNDPYVKAFIAQETVTNTPLLVFIGKAVAVGNGISGTGGSCPCYTKTINFVINPVYVGSSSAAANAIYVDSATHLAGFLNAQIASSNPNQLVQIVNNNDTSGLHVYNGAGGPNSNNGSGFLTGSLLISTDGKTLTGTISSMYKPSYGTGSSCAGTYYVSATKVQ